MHKTSVRIRDDQKKWLDANDGVNLSGVVREAIDDMMENGHD